MASKPYEVRWTKTEIGQQIAVARDGTGFAWRQADVEADPRQYDWRIVLGKDRDGPVIDKGGPGVNGRFVVVRDINRGDQEMIASYVQHIRNAQIARDRQSEDQLRKQLERRIARVK